MKMLVNIINRLYKVCTKRPMYNWAHKFCLNNRICNLFRFTSKDLVKWNLSLFMVNGGACSTPQEVLDWVRQLLGGTSFTIPDMNECGNVLISIFPGFSESVPELLTLINKVPFDLLVGGLMTTILIYIPILRLFNEFIHHFELPSLSKGAWAFIGELVTAIIGFTVLGAALWFHTNYEMYEEAYYDPVQKKARWRIRIDKVPGETFKEKSAYRHAQVREAARLAALQEQWNAEDSGDPKAYFENKEFWKKARALNKEMDKTERMFNYMYYETYYGQSYWYRKHNQ